jgi:glycerol-3-phosphate O-acyltransferase
LLDDPRFPATYKPILLAFFSTYRTALTTAGLDAEAYDHLLVGFVERMQIQLDQPFTFEPYHAQITHPFDYYRFGVEFLRPLVDKSLSTLHGRAELDRVAATGSRLFTGTKMVTFCGTSVWKRARLSCRN